MAIRKKACILILGLLLPALLTAQVGLRAVDNRRADTLLTKLRMPMDTLRINFDEVRESRTVCYTVCDAINNQPVMLAHVVNRSKRIGTVSGTNGKVCLPVSFGDSLYISVLGYERKHLLAFGLAAPDTAVNRIALQPVAYPIEEVRVFSPGSYDRFLRSVERLQLPLTAQEMLQRRLMEYIKKAPVVKRAPIPGSIEQLSSGVMHTFGESWLMQQNRKVREARKYDRELELIARKYSPAMVQHLTGLQGDSLTRFIQHIDLPHAYLRDATEYDISVRILDSLRTFRRSPALISTDTLAAP